MKTIVIGVTATVLLAVAFVAVKVVQAPDPAETSAGHQMMYDRSQAAEETQQDRWTGEEVMPGFVIDESKLHDPAYENSPDIRAIAELQNIPARCVIEYLRDENAEMSSDACRDAWNTRGPKPLEVYVTSPVWDRYSNEELRMLAESEPDAAILLGRRSEDYTDVRYYFELGMEMLEDRGVDTRSLRRELEVGRKP